MANAEMQVTVRMRWWAVPFIRTLGFLCRALRLKLNQDKLVQFIARHGIKYSFK
jgi:hypothetical protein